MTFVRQHPGLTILHQPQVLRPPNHPSIAMAWVELDYGTRASPDVGRAHMAYSTVRHLRSAAGWYETVGRLTAEGGSWAYEEKGDRLRKG
eukprot:scaffold44489_cov741-Amphora_coffeaeformis.AAC.1